MGLPRSERGLGIALVIAAAIAWSMAPFFTRLLPFDPWTILFWRGLFAVSLIVVLLVLMQGRAALRQLLAGSQDAEASSSRHCPRSAWSRSSPLCR